MGKGNQLAIDNATLLNPNDVAYPCGYLAYYYFNDSIKLVKEGGVANSLNNANIVNITVQKAFNNQFSFKNLDKSK